MPIVMAHLKNIFIYIRYKPRSKESIAVRNELTHKVSPAGVHRVHWGSSIKLLKARALKMQVLLQLLCDLGSQARGCGGKGGDLVTRVRC